MTLGEFLKAKRGTTRSRADAVEAAQAVWTRDHGDASSGISEVSLGFWERGDRVPSSSQARALAEAVGASPAELVTVLTEMLPSAEVHVRRPAPVPQPAEGA